MSKGLLKRVIAECSDEGSRSNITTKLYGAITEYLEMPEPEPVAWAIFRKSTMYDFSRTQPGEELLGQMGDYAIPVYTTPPDQSARIAELERALMAANADIESLENRLLVKNQRLYEYNEKLATLQAREPLSNEEIELLRVKTLHESEGPLHLDFHERFARAIEQHHGITE